MGHTSQHPIMQRLHGFVIQKRSQSPASVPYGCINAGSPVLLQLSIDIPLLFTRAGRTLRMLGLFSVSQVDAVSVLGTINKDKAVVPDDWRAAGEDCRTGRGTVGLTRKARDGLTERGV